MTHVVSVPRHMTIVERRPDMLEVWRRMVIGSAIAMYLTGLVCAGDILLKGTRHGERLAVTEVTR
jgi:hypothetical protein